MAFFLPLFVVLATIGVADATPVSVWDSVPDSLAERADTLSLTGALARIKRGSPELRAIPFRGAAAAAQVEQAGAWPNPSLLALAENVDGSYNAFDRSEISLWLSQELELGGKRSKRVDFAVRMADEVARESRAQSFDVYLMATSRYAAVVHAEERARVARAAEGIVAELARVASDRVKVGATLTADAALADAELARVGFAIAEAEVERSRARVALASTWGEPLGFDDAVARAIPVPRATLSADSAGAWAHRSPDLERLRLSGASHRADAAVERSLRVPDLALDAGARLIEADDATTLLFGVALPLPLWDRRAGSIRAAEARAAATEIEIERVRASVTGEILGHLANVQRLRDRLRRTEAELAPAVEAALDNMRTAYAIGRASYSDLLDVQRALLELRNDANDARLAIVYESITIERLTGRTIEELTGNE